MVAKLVLDGHDRGAKVVARALRDAGMDVVYTGLHKTPEEVVIAAIQEDVDVLGVSLLSGAHMTLIPKVLELLKAEHADDILIVAGGVFPDADVAAMKQMGVARVMWAAGVRPSDTVMICSFFSLYIGSWGALVGTERLGAAAFPFGAGVSGQTQMAVNWARDLQPTAFYGTPSYALHFADTARKQGIDPRSFGLRTLFFSGEPGAGIPSTKKLIEETFGGVCIDMGSMAEATPWMTNGECRHRTGMHLWQDIVYTQVCDPQTFHPVPYGSEGTPVYTHLERTSQPMIRLVSGDLARWTDAPCPCGRTYPRLPDGLHGRIDDMFIVRGENIYPGAIEDTLRAIDGFGGEFRVIVSRTDPMDELLIQAEYAGAFSEETAQERLRTTMRERLRTRLGVRPVIELVAEGTIPRIEFKARRVVDNRDLYRQSLDRG